MEEARASSPASQLTEQVGNTCKEAKEFLSLGCVQRIRLRFQRVKTPEEGKTITRVQLKLIRNSNGEIKNCTPAYIEGSKPQLGANVEGTSQVRDNAKIPITVAKDQRQRI